MKKKNIEEHYRKLLDNPEPGNLKDLEKKYANKTAEFRTVKGIDGFHISAVQQNGEITNAYLYLKALWSVSSRKNRRSAHLVPKKKKPFLTISKTYSKLKILSKAACVMVIASTLVQAIIYTMGFPKRLELAKYENLAQDIKDESSLHNYISKVNAEEREPKTLFNPVPLKLNTSSSQPEIIKEARKCNYSRLNNLLKNNKSPIQRNLRGETALHWVARRNCINEALLLLNHQANPYIKDASGKSPIHWAEASNNIEMLHILKGTAPKFRYRMPETN